MKLLLYFLALLNYAAIIAEGMFSSGSVCDLAVVIVHIYLPVTGRRKTQIVGRSMHFSLR